MHKKHVLLTGGRAPVTLDLVRKFARGGYQVSVAESIPVHLCRYSKLVQQCYTVPPPNTEPKAFISALLEIIRTAQIDLLLPTCEEIFFVAQGLEILSKYCTVFVAPGEQMRRLHSKWDFIQTAQDHGLTVPETHLITSLNDMQQFLAHNKQPFVVKPVFSRFATQVYMFDEAQLATTRLTALPISEHYPWVAQERIKGQAFSTYSIAHAGKLAAHATYTEHFTAGRGACIDFRPIEQPAIERWVEHFVQCEHFTGQIAFDFIVTADGRALPLECNPRSTSGIHLFQQDDGFLEAFFCASATRAIIKPDPKTHTMLALAMLCYGLPAIGSWRRGLEWLQTSLRARDVIFDWHDIRPFLAQPLILWYNWQGSRRFHISILAFSTRDIEFPGP